VTSGQFSRPVVVGLCRPLWDLVSFLGCYPALTCGANEWRRFATGSLDLALWHDGAMSKRSRKIAKRGEFENSLKEIEENLRSRRENKSAEITAEAAGRSEERDGGGEVKSKAESKAADESVRPTRADRRG
jgi:hypothetical protein